MKTIILSTISVFLLLGTLSPAHANQVEVADVKASQSADKSWNFEVTLKHDDKGWEHYANEWQIIGPDNKILGTRTLYHPHVKEQPFTRSLSGVEIPSDLKSVRVIAKDTVHGLSQHAIKYDLSTKKAEKITLDLKKANAG